MHWCLWVGLVVLILLIVYLSAQREGYAAPRDSTTELPFKEDMSNQYMTSNNSPYVESTGNVVPADSQSQIYLDMGGLDSQLQAGNPILNLIQGDPRSNVIYGDFVANDAAYGSAAYYPIQGEGEAEVDNGQYLPELTSPSIPFLGESLPPVPANPPLMSPDMSGLAPPLTPIQGATPTPSVIAPNTPPASVSPTSPVSLPLSATVASTSSATPPTVNASESPASSPSPAVAQ
jgi:hypothetical protein